MKVAIIGCGRIARFAHLPALSKIEGVRIKYGCDIIEEKAKKLKEDFPIIEEVITDYKLELFSDGLGFAEDNDGKYGFFNEKFEVKIDFNTQLRSLYSYYGCFTSRQARILRKAHYCKL